jgi:hypothetical protein|eukprot:SAG25_NODE_52_length_18732_cov_99.030484_14_plen_31_part_00
MVLVIAGSGLLLLSLILLAKISENSKYYYG